MSPSLKVATTKKLSQEDRGSYTRKIYQYASLRDFLYPIQGICARILLGTKYAMGIYVHLTTEEIMVQKKNMEEDKKGRMPGKEKVEGEDKAKISNSKTTTIKRSNPASSRKSR